MVTRDQSQWSGTCSPTRTRKAGKGSLLFFIIQHFTPLLFPPLLLTLLVLNCYQLAMPRLLRGVKRMVDSGVYVACATSVNSEFLKYHMKWPHILHRCSSQYALWLHCWKNQDCVQDTVRLNQLEAGHACHVVLNRYNKISHTMNY